jgi:hypothetical protein
MKKIVKYLLVTTTLMLSVFLLGCQKQIKPVDQITVHPDYYKCYKPKSPELNELLPSSYYSSKENVVIRESNDLVLVSLIIWSGCSLLYFNL